MGNLSLIVAGAGLQNLAGSNNYAGGTQITGGTLQLGNANALGTGAWRPTGESSTWPDWASRCPPSAEHRAP